MKTPDPSEKPAEMHLGHFKKRGQASFSVKSTTSGAATTDFANLCTRVGWVETAHDEIPHIEMSWNCHMTNAAQQAQQRTYCVSVR